MFQPYDRLQAEIHLLLYWQKFPIFLDNSNRINKQPTINQTDHYSDPRC
jgi:hypothetical protein